MQRLLRFSGLLSPTHSFSLPLILVGGSLGDLYGRRRILPVVSYSASVWVVGLSPNVNQLILARAVQELGALS